MDRSTGCALCVCLTLLIRPHRPHLCELFGASQTRAAVITNRENVVITRHAPELIANVREPSLHCTSWVLAYLVAPPCLAHPETHGSTLNTLDVVPRRIQQHVGQVSKQHSHSCLTQRRAVLLSAVALVFGMSHDALSTRGRQSSAAEASAELVR